MTQETFTARSKSRMLLAVLGFWIGIGLCKFGNPVILDRLVERPSGLVELVFQPWPLAWGYLLGIPLVLLVLLQARWPSARGRWILLAPLPWFLWQVLSSTQTVDPQLTRSTLSHFGFCVGFFAAGFLVVSRYSDLRPFWLGFALPFCFVLWLGFDQHYGGLQASREQFYAMPNWRSYPPDFIKKIESNRIFSTLVYPNALACAIILFLPATTLALLSGIRDKLRIPFAVATGLWVYAGLACLYWSGSKSAWLITLVLLLFTLFHIRFNPRAKAAAAILLVLFGLTGFFLKFSAYFRKGATSVVARFDYWGAARKTAFQHPVLGTGPGTFSVPYKKLKRPESEMARLVHNDYLEQFSDSGLAGGLAFLALIPGLLIYLYRSRIKNKPFRVEEFCLWISLIGWSLQAFVEFPLYIPGLAWPFFLFLGYLLGVNVIVSSEEASAASTVAQGS